MESEIPKPERSREHRWMTAGFIATGLLVLPLLMLRTGLLLRTGSTAAVTHAAPTLGQSALPHQTESQPVEINRPVPDSQIVRSRNSLSADATSDPNDISHSTVRPEPSETQAAATPLTTVSETFARQTVAESPARIEPPAALSESELLASLQETAVEFDLYTLPDKGDRPREYLKEVHLKTKAARESIADLRASLAKTPRFSQSAQSLLAAVPGAAQEIEDNQEQLRNRLAADLNQARNYTPLRRWLSERPDLARIPVSMDDSCRISDDRARELQRVSLAFQRMRRTQVTKVRRSGRSPTGEQLFGAFDNWVEAEPEAFLETLNSKHAHWGSVPGLVQIMQGHPETVRLMTVRSLSTIPAPDASAAIAGRAVYDLSPKVRAASIEALKQRDRSEFRSVLLSGLRYLWPPVAQHAATALVAVNDQDARSDLLDLSGKPDPRAPQPTEAGGWSVHELSSVNHLRNCLLCHAPTLEPVARPIGNVPSPGEPLPAQYYSTGLATIRADVTYLRQDFSVLHEVENAAPWPKQQRFDYFVSTRPLEPSEARELQAKYSDRDYPQRRSVLFALQELDARREDHAIAARD